MVRFSPAVGAAPVKPRGAYRNRYASILGWALRHKPLVLGTVALLFAGALLQARTLGANLIPEFSQGELRFGIELPEGTPIEHTDEVMARLEARVGEVAGVDRVFSNVGLDADDSGGTRSKRENRAELNLRLDPGVRGDAEDRVASAVRIELETVENLKATLYRPTTFSFRAPVAVEIYGYDLDDLARASDLVVGALGRIDGLKDVKSSLQPGSPEVRVRFDRDRLQLAGLELRSASEALRTKVRGSVATDYKERDRQIEVLVRSDDAQNISFERLPSLVVGHHDGMPVRLAAVADLEMDRGPAEIERVGQSRAVTVSADLDERDLAGVSEEIASMLAGLPLPASVTTDVAGQNEEMQSSLQSLQFAIALAIFLVYLVMASQFESLLDPFLILFTVPLALIGVVLALKLSSTVLSVVVMIGGVMLAGIVVNNGIVLVDLIGQLRRRGYGVTDAVLEAGSTRLRPILMTTTTTVLGLVPLALGRGDGAELGAPLAITVIGGLVVSAALTLVVIPVLYGLVHREA
jgi:HAE1 family hydrophobic/amphiphilic exporter-1